jgi:hypothetical protein
LAAGSEAWTAFLCSAQRRHFKPSSAGALLVGPPEMVPTRRNIAPSCCACRGPAAPALGRPPRAAVDPLLNCRLLVTLFCQGCWLWSRREGVARAGRLQRSARQRTNVYLCRNAKALLTEAIVLDEGLAPPRRVDLKKLRSVVTVKKERSEKCVSLTHAHSLSLFPLSLSLSLTHTHTHTHINKQTNTQTQDHTRPHAHTHTHSKHQSPHPSLGHLCPSPISAIIRQELKLTL